MYVIYIIHHEKCVHKVFTLSLVNEKSHLLAVITYLISDTYQVVRKYHMYTLSMKYSILILLLLLFLYWYTCHLHQVRILCLILTQLYAIFCISNPDTVIKLSFPERESSVLV